MSATAEGLWMPGWIRNHPELLPIEKLLLAEIGNRQGSGGCCLLGNMGLSRLLGTDPGHVRYLIGRMTAAGLVRLEVRRSARGYGYERRLAVVGWVGPEQEGER